MKIQKQIIIEKNVITDLSIEKHFQEISSYLLNEKFHSIVKDNNSITAFRGRHFFNSGDPRKIYQKIIITNDKIIFIIDSWFGIFSDNDYKIFEFQTLELQEKISGKKLLSISMEEIQKQRKKSDIKTLLITVLVGVILGVILSIFSQ